MLNGFLVCVYIIPKYMTKMKIRTDTALHGSEGTVRYIPARI